MFKTLAFTTAPNKKDLRFVLAERLPLRNMKQQPEHNSDNSIDNTTNKTETLHT
jgi:hypothetical protein